MTAITIKQSTNGVCNSILHIYWPRINADFANLKKSFSIFFLFGVISVYPRKSAANRLFSIYATAGQYEYAGRSRFPVWRRGTPERGCRCYAKSSATPVLLHHRDAARHPSRCDGPVANDHELRPGRKLRSAAAS